MDYRIDDVGFVRDRMKRLFAFDAIEAVEAVEAVQAVDGGAGGAGGGGDGSGGGGGKFEIEPLTGSGFDAEHPVWTPDGTRIVFTAPPEWDAVESRVRAA